jgi:hypothetical protein
MEDYSQRQVDKINAVRDQENEAAKVQKLNYFNCQAFTEELEDTVITIEEKKQIEETTGKELQKVATQKHSMKVDLDLGDVVLVKKKTTKRKLEDTNQKKKKKKVEKEAKPVLLVQYESSDDEKN